MPTNKHADSQTTAGSPQSAGSSQARSAQRVVTAVESLEGGGFQIHRPFPTRALPMVDPFLLLDRMGPMDVGPGEAKGAPDHPHRGFETVTYLLDGGMEHADSAGNRGSLRPGDVQWMTAGRGVVHAELPAADILAKGGRMHGFQLWVNLPRAEKMRPPRYQDVPSARIPVVTTDDGRVKVKVIAGSALGAEAIIETRIPITYLHVTLAPGAVFTQPVSEDANAVAYVFGGRGSFGAGADKSREAVENQLVIFGRDGHHVRMEAAADAEAPLEALFLAAVPLGEPVARYGPFVMNTAAEIQQAVADYQSGRLGRIEG